MNNSTKSMFGRFVWFASGVGCIVFGLQAMNISILSLINLDQLILPMQYAFGLCGVASILMFFSKCCKTCKTR